MTYSNRQSCTRVRRRRRRRRANIRFHAWFAVSSPRLCISLDFSRPDAVELKRQSYVRRQLRFRVRRLRDKFNVLDQWSQTQITYGLYVFFFSKKVW